MSKYSNLLRLVEEKVKSEEEFSNAPIFTVAVEQHVQGELEHTFPPTPDDSPSSVHDQRTFQSMLNHAPAPRIIPQYGLIGTREEAETSINSNMGDSPEDRLVLANMNMPWSTFICGSQGAGKSHTIGCLLENALLENQAAGELPNPLAAMVMHYDNYSSQDTTQVCEAAYLSSYEIPVTVLVSPSNIWNMKRLYSNLPGVNPFAPKPKVLPLYLEEYQLDISRILKIMGFDTASGETPLYMDVLTNLVREMAMERSFSYREFRRRLSQVEWMKGQNTALNMRLQILDTIVAPSEITKTTRPARAQENIWAFNRGSLTIVDLSDPFFSSDDACTVFSICLSIFLEERNKCGRVVVLDEAHKFLHKKGEAKVLTDDLLSVIRQQRHTGTRVIIATQEPTLSPELIDLSTVTLVHRFLSPSWYKVLENHLAGATNRDRKDDDSLFDQIVTLRTGQALIFCPTAQMDIVAGPTGPLVKPLGNGYVKINVRKRLAVDSGVSIMATDVPTRVPTQEEDYNVPMYVVNRKPEQVQKNPEANKPKRGNVFLEAPKHNPAMVASASQNDVHMATEDSMRQDYASIATRASTRKDSVPMNKLIAEARRQVRILYSEDNTSFSMEALSKKDRSRLFKRLESALNLRVGSSRENKEFMHHCEKNLNQYLIDYKALMTTPPSFGPARPSFGLSSFGQAPSFVSPAPRPIGPELPPNYSK
ncbi:hypothetical protein GGR54DRAFT_433560 [Hypoxylon sp. NC1633]|nr:hypothetical protein GGR54DRAFT_433560 [Hypoxylon sp. NC1633]